MIQAPSIDLLLCSIVVGVNSVVHEIVELYLIVAGRIDTNPIFVGSDIIAYNLVIAGRINVDTLIIALCYTIIRNPISI